MFKLNSLIQSAGSPNPGFSISRRWRRFHLLSWPISPPVLSKFTIKCIDQISFSPPAFNHFSPCLLWKGKPCKTGMTIVLILYKLVVIKLAHYKDTKKQAFGICGPSHWNKLPLSIKSCSSVDSFKCALKTHLFKLTYY